MSILEQLSRNAEALSSGVDPDVDHDSSSQPSSAASDRPTKGSTPARVVILMAGRRYAPAGRVRTLISPD